MFYTAYNSFIILKSYTPTLLRLLGALLLLFVIGVPVVSFKASFSTLLEAEDGSLLGARIAPDGQWRFPGDKDIPEKFEACILHFEDQYFYYHPGINPVSVMRALYQNISQANIVSGASTITMQTVRLASTHRERTLWQKIKESILTLRMELSKSKKEILSLYATHAPFGGNVVGLEAASWRYFSCPPENLSWAQSATLAVLPNAPSLMYPGKNTTLLRQKRDRLLKKLYVHEIIDSMSYQLACQEPMPERPQALPQHCPHLLDRCVREYPQQRTRSSIDAQLQKQCIAITQRHNRRLAKQYIHNLGVLILDNQSGQVLCYIGNSDDPSKSNNNDVDMITSLRSSASTLKPLLFAAMIQKGLLLPHMLLEDTPQHFSGYSPQNFSLKFQGAIPASEAITRSLNIPAILMLKQYGIAHFHELLQRLGFSTITQESDHYGLALILGGSEISLWELCRVYAALANSLLNKRDEERARASFTELSYRMNSEKDNTAKSHYSPLHAGACWWMFETMKNTQRPGDEEGWQFFENANAIAWKTGTSFGFRDAWTVGLTPHYTVGVWVGNANGEGRPGNTGINAAAPLFFDLFRLLPQQVWFEEPIAELYPASICKHSGHRASQFCEDLDTLYVPKAALQTSPCPYHQVVHLDSSGIYRVNSSCYSPPHMQHKSWFVLPPIMAWYYQQQHPEYLPLPPYKSGCQESLRENMRFIYPKLNSKLYIPYELTGERGEVVFKVAHQKPNTNVYWHLDGKYLGHTYNTHEFGLSPSPGKHLITLIDESGSVIKKRFTILGKEEK